MIRSIFGALAMMALSVCAAMPAAAVPIDPGISMALNASADRQAPATAVEHLQIVAIAPDAQKLQLPAMGRSIAYAGQTMNAASTETSPPDSASDYSLSRYRMRC
ncbi:hypothetical protein [Gellertiella hungarica]|uniref:Uncharacterized protein n=1 Tax=Gellertiella hungarica TaxID=1572859 RepID=A0A7W6NJF2_9HYPH|nr:hypothetical protein [Gellertiella hungarica]MBB4063668.1 hypothetical protein [Gellertiella hungarica]